MLEGLVDKDFANYWIAARLVLGGQALDLFSDHATYFRHLTEAFGPDYPWRNWSYPPHYLLFIWPLGLVDYPIALLGFLAVTLVAYLVSVRAFVGVGALAKPSTLFILMASVVGNIDAAQNGFLTSALMLGGLAVRDTRPVLAGVLFGCLTIKPQLGVLVPVLLLYERQWRVIGAATLTTIALILMSGALFGWASWTGYIEHTLAYQKRVMTQFTGIFLYMMPSTFGTLRLIGSDANLALMLHGAVAGLALVLAALVLSRCRDAGLRGAVLILMTLVVTPYWLSYDYGMAAGAIALAYKGNPGVTRGERRRRSLLLLSSLAPIAVIPPPQLAIPLAPLLVLIGCATVLATAAKIQGNAADNDPRSVT